MHAVRPRNETARNLQSEADARHEVERVWGYRVVNLQERLYEVDWALFHSDNNSLYGYGEFKERGAEYPTIILGAAKYLVGMALARSAGVDFFFFVEFPGKGLHYCNVSGIARPDFELAGNNRGQPGDKEPCAMIPRAFFWPLTD
jgi:hypothetical protein